MRGKLIFVILGLIFCIVFSGCHTFDALSKVHTGNVDPLDVWEAFKADDKDFQETFW